MNETKRILKFIEKNADQRFDLDSHIVFVTDSKGKYLKRQQKYLNVRHGSITWLDQGGRKTPKGIKALEDNIEELLHKHNKICVLFWHGTCDVTTKTGNHLFPHYKNSEEVKSDAIKNLDKLNEIADKHTNLKIFTAEIPPISIRKWNQSRDYEHWVAQSDDDINDHIREYNTVIREKNESTGFRSPKFEQDLVRSRKKKNQQTKYTLNFNLLTDGIHPTGIVAKYWLLRLLQAINNSLM